MRIHLWFEARTLQAVLFIWADKVIRKVFTEVREQES